MDCNPSVSKLLIRGTQSILVLALHCGQARSQIPAQTAASSPIVTGFLSMRVLLFALLLSKSRTVQIQRAKKAKKSWSSLKIEICPPLPISFAGPDHFAMQAECKPRWNPAWPEKFQLDVTNPCQIQRA